MYTLRDIFLYSPDRPMIFTQYLFWIFFTVLMAGYALVYKKTRVKLTYLTLFSLFYYYKAGGYFFFLLVFSTIFDYNIGNLIHRARKRGWRLFFLVCTIAVNLGLLSFFKYFYFFTDILNSAFGAHVRPYNFLAAAANAATGSHFDVARIILPVGISFFTFQTISYTVDVYRRRIEPAKNIFDFGFFVTFFPQLVAGPIVRAADFLPQLYRPFLLNAEEFNRAAYLIMNGLAKKILISDYISTNFVDRVFDNPLLYSGFENLMAVFGYGLQIYCDFSGYTDIAIGLALFLGFRLPINFNSPFKSANVTEFWRRWHISLSTWLNDYVFIPFITSWRNGGAWAVSLGLILTFFLSGLWHGAGWTFILFGMLHGLAMVYEYLTRKTRKKVRKAMPTYLYNGISIALTFLFTRVCWIYFRASDIGMAHKMFDRIFNHFSWDLVPQMLYGYRYVFAIIVLGHFVVMMPEKWKSGIVSSFYRMPLAVKAIVVAGMVVLLYQVTSAGVQPFIYFQF